MCELWFEDAAADINPRASNLCGDEKTEGCFLRQFLI